MNKYPYTPAPWEADDDGRIYAEPSDEEASGAEAAPCVARACDGPNARRIVACVNACEGIEDPAAALAEVRRRLTEVVNELPYAVAVLDGERKESTARAVRELIGEIRRALALLTPPARCTSTSSGHGHTGTWTEARNVGRCETEYTCGGPHGCGRRFTIDSSG